MWVPPQGYLQYIKSLPLNDSPELFGLHDNANITFAQNETFALLGAITQLQPKTFTVGGRSREEVGAPIPSALAASTRRGQRGQTPALSMCYHCQSHPTGQVPATALPSRRWLSLFSAAVAGRMFTHMLSSFQLVEEICKDILAKLPAPMNLQEVIHKYPLLYEESMNTVLVQEVIR